MVCPALCLAQLGTGLAICLPCFWIGSAFKVSSHRCLAVALVVAYVLLRDVHASSHHPDRVISVLCFELAFGIDDIFSFGLGKS